MTAVAGSTVGTTGRSTSPPPLRLRELVRTELVRPDVLPAVTGTTVLVERDAAVVPGLVPVVVEVVKVRPATLPHTVQ
jgi:hypothetical protein